MKEIGGICIVLWLAGCAEPATLPSETTSESTRTEDSTEPTIADTSIELEELSGERQRETKEGSDTASTVSDDSTDDIDTGQSSGPTDIVEEELKPDSTEKDISQADTSEEDTGESSGPADIEEEPKPDSTEKDIALLDGSNEETNDDIIDTETDAGEEKIDSETWDIEEPLDTTECDSCSTSSLSAVHALDSTTWTLPSDRTKHNPLKGFMTSYLWSNPANDFPDQMEFAYIPMSSVWGPEGPTFDTAIEPLLVASASRNHHLVLRIFIDYPTKPSGLPQFLAEEVPCQVYSDHGGGCSPDYDHPKLVEAMTGLLTQLGLAYDGDPRLGALQIGLIGFWGEWHTFPHSDWFPSVETQKAVLSAAENAFQTTQIQLRKPMANSGILNIGYHDDSFGYSTLGNIEWFFWPSIITAGESLKWETAMMGGELRPEIQGICFQENYVIDTYAQNIEECIETTHMTYILNYKAFSENGTGYLGDEREMAETVSGLLGYRFELKSASLELNELKDDEINALVTLELQQTGVAPFYYDLSASLMRTDGSVLSTHEANLKNLLPGDTAVLEFDLGTVAVSEIEEPYELVLHSPILLPEQQLLVATKTPDTGENQPTTLQWQVECKTDTETLKPGEFVQAEEACPCRCDVDGLMYFCDGNPCP